MNIQARKKPASAAQRMRDYRERRREGWRCVRVTISPESIRGLVKTGHLDADLCHDQRAIEIAVDNFINYELPDLAETH